MTAENILQRLRELVPGVVLPPAATALDSFAAVDWPQDLRFETSLDEFGELRWYGPSAPSRRGGDLVLAEVGDQRFVSARADDADDDPTVFLVDHEDSEDRRHALRLSAFLATVRATPVVVPPGASPETCGAQEGRLLLRAHARTTDPELRRALNAMALRLGLLEIVPIRLGWGDTDLRDLLPNRIFWRAIFQSAERRGATLGEVLTSALASKELDLRLHAIEHVGRTRGDLGALRPSLRDGDARVVSAVARAIGRSGREEGQALLEPLLRDKRTEVTTAALLALIELRGTDAAKAVSELILRRAADTSASLWGASARGRLKDTAVPGETLADFVAWASGRKDVEVLCDVTSAPRAGRLRAKLSNVLTLVNGKPQPAAFGDVAPHFARTLGVGIFHRATGQVAFVEPAEAARLWSERIEAEGGALFGD